MSGGQPTSLSLLPPCEPIYFGKLVGQLLARAESIIPLMIVAS
jgi:hypothetical protein